MANLAYNRTAWQYYDGFAYYTIVDGMDYSQRKAAIEKNLNNAYNRFIKRTDLLSDTPVLDTYFIKKIDRLAQQTYAKEVLLYNYLNIPIIELPMVESNNDLHTYKTQVEQYLKDIKDTAIPPLNKYFYSTDKIDASQQDNAWEFLMFILRDEFLHTIAGHKTQLSRTRLFDAINGYQSDISVETKQEKGGIMLAKPVAKIIASKKGFSTKAFGDLVAQIYSDIIQSYSEDLIPEEIGQQIMAVIAEIIQDNLSTTILGKKGVKGIDVIQSSKKSYDKKVQEIIQKLVQKTYMQNKMKKFYKDVYLELKKRLSSIKELQSLGQRIRFMEGSLSLYDNFQTSAWYQEITLSVYDETPEEKEKHRKKTNIDRKEIFRLTLNLIKETIANMPDIPPKNKKDAPPNRLKALAFISNQRNFDICVDNLVSASRSIADSSFPSWIGSFAVQKVSGVLGEISKVILTDERLCPRIVAKKSNNDESFVDVKVTVSYNNKKVPIGVQVKRTEKDSISLYNNKKLDIFDDTFYTFFNKSEGRLLRYIFANEQFMQDKLGITITEDQFLQFIDNFSPEYIRYIKEKGIDYRNNFYALGKNIYPTSYILLKMALQIVNIFLGAEKNSHFFQFQQKKKIFYATENDFDSNNIEYKQQIIDTEQSVDKITPTLRHYKNAMPINIESNGTLYPIHIDKHNEKFENKIKIVFKGILINLD